jgi:hypothetical protein
VVSIQGTLLTMALIRKPGIMLASAAAFVVLTLAAPVHALSYKQAMAACRAKYGNGVTSVVIKKSGQIVCREGPSGKPTRKQVYDYCKKTLSPQMLMVVKRPNGKWECRYYGRF